MQKILLALFVLLPVWQACTGHGHTPGAVQTNNGQRWKANPETTAGIASMQAILAKYEEKTGDAAGRTALQEELELAFQDIFKKCTMTGEAHEQLHNYLLPMKNMFEKIGGATESEPALEQLKKHLEEYQNYFE